MTAPQVVVVGAGLAGATFAACAAVRGHPVTVLDVVRDPARIPNDIEPFAPGVHRVFAELGVAERMRSVLARQETVTVDWNDGTPPWRSPHHGPPPYDHGCHAAYGDVVAKLLERASDGGARIIRGADVIGPELDDGRCVGVRYRMGGEVVFAPASRTVDASGTARVVAGQLSAVRDGKRRGRLKRSRVDGIESTEFLLSNITEKEWSWSVPANGVVGYTRFTAGEDDAGEEWMAARCDRFAGPGWLAVGDAAAVVDPGFLEPATIAVLAARSAAAGMCSAGAGSAACFADRYTSCYSAAVDSCSAFAEFFLDPARCREDPEDLLRGFMDLLGADALADVRGALAGGRPLFDVEAPRGAVLATLEFPDEWR